MATATTEITVNQVYRLNAYTWGIRNDLHEPIPYGTVASVRVVTREFIKLLALDGRFITVEPWRLERDWVLLGAAN